LRYSVTALPSGNVKFNLLTATESLETFNTPKDFIWMGDPQARVQLSVEVPDFGKPEPEEAKGKPLKEGKSGPLAIFQLVDDLQEDGQLSGPNYTFNVNVIQGLGRHASTEQKLRFAINAGAASLLFERGLLASLPCTAKVGQ